MVAKFWSLYTVRIEAFTDIFMDENLICDGYKVVMCGCVNYTEVNQHIRHSSSELIVSCYRLH
jgi:hypothetical protein